MSRELGIPAVIGTGNATDVLTDGQEVTLSCVEGIYEGILAYESQELDLKALPDTDTQIMLNVASPAAALNWWRLPAEGIGLARMEYIVNNVIEVHPMALVAFDQVEDGAARARIEELTQGYDDKTEYFVDHLSRGIGSIAATQYPDPVLVRTSDL